MARFDRYMLSQLLVLFGLFSLVLVSVLWVNRAVVLFDELIADGQSALVFLEFSALTLPSAIRRVLPLAAFAATVYVTNRLSTESELTVMQATGFSPWRLARPVLWFGIIVGLMMSILSHFLVPASQAQLGLREDEVAQSVTARLLREGAFLHPSEGVTFYIRDIEPSGELRDVFLSDRRNPERTVTYTAQEAYLVRDERGPKLVMVTGLAQAYSPDGGRLSVTEFSDFTYDVSALIEEATGPRLRVRFTSTMDLLGDTEAVAERIGTTTARVLQEGHSRFNQAFLGMVGALIGFSALLVGGFSRFGVTRQIIFAIALLVVVNAVDGAITDPARSNAKLWPLVYAPSVVGLAMAVGLLAWAAAPARRPRGAVT